MTVFKGSRYEGVDAIKIVDEDGNEKRILKDREFTNLDIGDTVRKKDTDEMDLMAFVEYDNEELWWVIADANRENLPLQDFIGLPQYTEINIPAQEAVRDL